MTHPPVCLCVARYVLIQPQTPTLHRSILKMNRRPGYPCWQHALDTVIESSLGFDLHLDTGSHGGILYPIIEDLGNFKPNVHELALH